MSMEIFQQAVSLVLTPEVLFFVVLGITIGMIFGAIPGLGGTLGMAVLLPFTLLLDGHTALIFLITIYNGACWGASISAILINVPGTAGAAATLIDGYPMAKKGRAYEALSLSAIASAVGGTIAAAVAILAVPVLIIIVLSMTSPEYFLIAFLGITLIAYVSKASLIKGIMAGSFGLLMTTIGMAPTVPEMRYTFGLTILYDGISFIAILMGVFAVTEMMNLIIKEGGVSESETIIKRSKRSLIKQVFSNPLILAKSAFIGLVVGSVPGSGASVANFVAYSEQVRSDSSKEYGTGQPEGVIAAETANNANVTGAVVPTIAFGVPGSAATSILLAGVILHGYTPGPGMFGENLQVTYAVFIGLFVSALVIFILGLYVVTYASYLTKIDTDYVIPLVIVLTLVGSFIVRVNFIDVITATIFGLFGYYMAKNNYSLIAFVLGAVLGGIAENNYYRSLQISGGTYDIFYTKPISLLIILIIVVVLAAPIIESTRSRLEF